MTANEADSMHVDDDPIAQWYKRKDEEMRAAQRRLEDAIKRDAPREEIRRLEEARDDAGYVGD